MQFTTMHVWPLIPVCTILASTFVYVCILQSYQTPTFAATSSLAEVSFVSPTQMRLDGGGNTGSPRGVT